MPMCAHTCRAPRACLPRSSRQPCGVGRMCQTQAPLLSAAGAGRAVGWVWWPPEPTSDGLEPWSPGGVRGPFQGPPQPHSGAPTQRWWPWPWDLCRVAALTNRHQLRGFTNSHLPSYGSMGQRPVRSQGLRLRCSRCSSSLEALEEGRFLLPRVFVLCAVELSSPFPAGWRLGVPQPQGLAQGSLHLRASSRVLDPAL